MIIVVLLLGVLLVYLVLQSIYRKYWSKNLTVNIKFKDDHVVCGQKTDLIEVITNDKKLPLPYVNVKYQVDKSLRFDTDDNNAAVSDNSYRNDIFSLLFYQKVTRTIPVTCTKRGLYSINGFSIVSTGVFMNELMVLNNSMHTEIVVYPQMADVSELMVPFNHVMGIVETNRNIIEDKFAFREIRDYETFDPMNSINWKASAKSGKLMVNKYNETMLPNVTLLLNLSNIGMQHYDTLKEKCISVAAGFSQMFIEKGVSVSIRCNGLDAITEEPFITGEGSDFFHLNEINTALARVDTNKCDADFIEVIETEILRASNQLYIMISADANIKLQEAYENLCHAKTGLWVLPFHPGMEHELKNCSAYLTALEVER